jgi:hypothetical protein
MVYPPLPRGQQRAAMLAFIPSMFDGSIEQDRTRASIGKPY